MFSILEKKEYILLKVAIFKGIIDKLKKRKKVNHFVHLCYYKIGLNF